MELLGPFVHALLWGVLPLLFYTAFRRYLQAINIVKPITFAVVSANLINFAGNWLLMYGNWGAPRMGLEGSGYSTSISRVYIALVLLIAVLRHERKTRQSASAHRAGGRTGRVIRRLIALGFPCAMQILAEGAVFGVVTVMAARFDEVSLAAHSIAVNVISITYMVPLGISSAAAVRVGQAVGPQIAGTASRSRVGRRCCSAPVFMGARRSGAGLRAPLDRAAVHAGSGGDRGQRGAAADRGALRDLRRPAGSRHRRAARTRRYADSGAGALGGILDRRVAGRLRPVLPATAGVCTGIWVGLTGALIADRS